jgi:putative MATE family efflux protein
MDLTRGSVPRLLAHFAWPFLLANLMQSIYNVVDMIVVGQFVGSAGLSAVNNGGFVTQLFFSIGAGLAMGAQVMIAQFKGAGDDKAQSETIGSVLSLTALIGLALMVIVVVFTRPILRLINMPEEAFEQGVDYLVICALGCLFIFGYNSICSILRGLGDSRRPMLFVAVSTVVNIVLDLLFVGVFGWEAGGAAAATVIAQAIAFAFSAVYLYRRRAEFVFDFSRAGFRMVGDRVKTILKIGLPFVVQFSFINISILFVISLVNSYGVAASAAYGVGSRVDSFATLPVNALTAAGATMVGQNIGAGKRKRAGSVVWWSLAIGLTIEAVIIVLVQVFAAQIVKIFNSDPDVVAIGVEYLRWLSISYIAHALMSAFFAMTNGSGFSSLTMVACLFDGLVLRISLAALFSIVLGYGLTGIFIGATIAPFGAATISGVYFFSGRWKTRAALTNTVETDE